ncbi:MAG: hypothetical protein U0804_26510 [Gemmataceae bacterium]
MKRIELRDAVAARRFVAEGLWFQRAVRPTAERVRAVLEWAMEIANEGRPLPPLGFVADVAHVALVADADHRPKEPLAVPGWRPELARRYEDHVLGRLYADRGFERAADAVRVLAGTDRVRGVAFLVDRVRERTDVGGVDLPVAVLRNLLTSNADEVLARAWDDLSRDGPSKLTVELLDELASGGLRHPDVLLATDIAALEDRSALGGEEQRIALEQIRTQTDALLEPLHGSRVRPLPGRREVPTRILDEDQYPVGGYTSISPRGSIESLLHSQLAYMEDGRGRDPDLFDVKFARDELFYYSRDENQFLRRRRAFVFVLLPDLVTSQQHSARFKDPELPVQRIVLILSVLQAVVWKLDEWLSTDAIRFEVLFVQDAGRRPMAEEAALCEFLLRPNVARGVAAVRHVADRVEAGKALAELARTAQVHALVVGTKKTDLAADAALVSGLVVGGPVPTLRADDVPVPLEAITPFEHWQEALRRVLQMWV